MVVWKSTSFAIYRHHARIFSYTWTDMSVPARHSGPHINELRRQEIIKWESRDFGGSLQACLTQSARLDCYLNRGNDPPPGHIVMWRGMSRLTDIELGFLMGSQDVGN